MSAEYGCEVSAADATEYKSRLMQFFSLLQQMDAAQKRKSNEQGQEDGNRRDTDTPDQS